MDDFNIYDDLELLHAQENQKAVEDLLWKEKYEVALNTIQTLQTEKKALNKKIKLLEINFASLLETARTEIKRKDNQICELRKEKDDICFRRNRQAGRQFNGNPDVGKDLTSEMVRVNPFSSDIRKVIPAKSDVSNEHDDDDPLTKRCPREQTRDEKRNYDKSNFVEQGSRNVREKDRHRNRSRDLSHDKNRHRHRPRSKEHSDDRNDKKHIDRFKNHKSNKSKERHDHKDIKSKDGKRRRHARDTSHTESSDNSWDREEKRHSHSQRRHYTTERKNYRTDYENQTQKIEDKPKEISKTSNDHKREQPKESKSENQLENAKSSSENRVSQKIEILQIEILKDVKDFKKKQSEAEKVKKPEPVDPVKVATEKSNQFLDALFDDSIMNQPTEPDEDIYNDLGEHPHPINTNADNKENQNFIKADENCNFQFQTPQKKSVTTLLNDIFGPSPAERMDIVFERKESITSVGESSNDFDFVPNIKPISNRKDIEITQSDLTSKVSTTHLNDLFGPSPAERMDVVFERKESITSVGESSNDFDFVPNIKPINNRKDIESTQSDLTSKVSSVDQVVSIDIISDEDETNIKETLNECCLGVIPPVTINLTQQNAAECIIDEEKTSELISSEKPSNVTKCIINEASTFKFVELDSSFYSSEDEITVKNKTTENLNTSRSEPDSLEFVKLKVLPSKQVQISDVETTCKNNNLNTATVKSVFDGISNGLQDGNRKQAESNCEKSDNIVDSTDNYKEAIQNKTRTDSIEKSSKHSHSEKKINLLEEKHIKRNENCKKDDLQKHSYSSKHSKISKHSKPRSTSKKDSKYSSDSRNEMEKRHHHHHHRPKESSHTKSNSSSSHHHHHHSHSSRKKSENNRHHSTRDRVDKINLTSKDKCDSITSKNDNSAVRSSPMLVWSDDHDEIPVKDVSGKDEIKDHVSSYQDQVMFLHCVDISDDEEVIGEKVKCDEYKKRFNNDDVPNKEQFEETDKTLNIKEIEIEPVHSSVLEDLPLTNETNDKELSEQSKISYSTESVKVNMKSKLEQPKELDSEAECIVTMLEEDIAFTSNQSSNINQDIISLSVDQNKSKNICTSPSSRESEFELDSQTTTPNICELPGLTDHQLNLDHQCKTTGLIQLKEQNDYSITNSDRISISSSDDGEIQTDCENQHKIEEQEINISSGLSKQQLKIQEVPKKGGDTSNCVQKTTNITVNDIHHSVYEAVNIDEINSPIYDEEDKLNAQQKNTINCSSTASQESQLELHTYNFCKPIVTAVSNDKEFHMDHQTSEISQSKEENDKLIENAVVIRGNEKNEYLPKGEEQGTSIKGNPQSKVNECEPNEHTNFVNENNILNVYSEEIICEAAQQVDLGEQIKQNADELHNSLHLSLPSSLSPKKQLTAEEKNQFVSTNGGEMNLALDKNVDLHLNDTQDIESSQTISGSLIAYESLISEQDTLKYDKLHVVKSSMSPNNKPNERISHKILFQNCKSPIKINDESTNTQILSLKIGEREADEISSQITDRVETCSTKITPTTDSSVSSLTNKIGAPSSLPFLVSPSKVLKSADGFESSHSHSESVASGRRKKVKTPQKFKEDAKNAKITTVESDQYIKPDYTHSSDLIPSNNDVTSSEVSTEPALRDKDKEEINRKGLCTDLDGSQTNTPHFDPKINEENVCEKELETDVIISTISDAKVDTREKFTTEKITQEETKSTEEMFPEENKSNDRFMSETIEENVVVFEKCLQQVGKEGQRVEHHCSSEKSLHNEDNNKNSEIDENCDQQPLTTTNTQYKQSAVDNTKIISYSKSEIKQFEELDLPHSTLDHEVKEVPINEAELNEAKEVKGDTQTDASIESFSINIKRNRTKRKKKQNTIVSPGSSLKDEDSNLNNEERHKNEILVATNKIENHKLNDNSTGEGNNKKCEPSTSSVVNSEDFNESTAPASVTKLNHEQQSTNDRHMMDSDKKLVQTCHYQSTSGSDKSVVEKRRKRKHKSETEIGTINGDIKATRVSSNPEGTKIDKERNYKKKHTQNLDTSSSNDDVKFPNSSIEDSSKILINNDVNNQPKTFEYLNSSELKVTKSKRKYEKKNSNNCPISNNKVNEVFESLELNSSELKPLPLSPNLSVEEILHKLHTQNETTDLRLKESLKKLSKEILESSALFAQLPSNKKEEKNNTTDSFLNGSLCQEEKEPNSTYINCNKTQIIQTKRKRSSDGKSDKATKRSKRLYKDNSQSPVKTCDTTFCGEAEKNQHESLHLHQRSSSNEKLCTPALTPTHHKIFLNDNFPDDPSPVYNVNDDDVQYQELDNRMRSMFQSPSYNQPLNGDNSIDPNNDCLGSESMDNLTVDETLNLSEKSTCDTSTSSRKVSLGSNEYVIESVGTHTANVFITRKRFKKRSKVTVVE